MNNSPCFASPYNQGFTLIELMISVALGALIVYTATAGFRVAAQSVTVANRLGIENAILRAGIQQAHIRLDFWTDFDNPEDPTQQQLRIPVGAALPPGGIYPNGGLPFTKMKDVFPYVPNADPELATGWNPKEQWSPSDSRTWWHNSVSQTNNTNLKCGRSSLFSNSKPTPNIPGYGIAGAPVAVTVPHSWLANQMWGMHSALGYYGFFDYMPAGTMFGCSIFGETGLNSGPKNQDGMARILLDQNSSFSFWTNAVPTTKSIFRLSAFSGYNIVRRTDPNANNPNAHRTVYNVGYSCPGPAAMASYLGLANEVIPMFPSGGPTAWPKADVSVARMIKTSRFVSLCSVTMTSPFSGETVKLNFSGFSTSLRGARQQRERTFGWARWDGAINPANDKTLDDTQ